MSNKSFSLPLYLIHLQRSTTQNINDLCPWKSHFSWRRGELKTGHVQLNLRTQSSEVRDWETDTWWQSHIKWLWIRDIHSYIRLFKLNLRNNSEQGTTDRLMQIVNKNCRCRCKNAFFYFNFFIDLIYCVVFSGMHALCKDKTSQDKKMIKIT